MLSIKPVGGSQQEVNYYSSLDDAENHDYYSEDGVRPGAWWGEGAEALGLVGDVDPNQFKNILEGMSPDGNDVLVQKVNGKERQRRSAFDLTISLPKSFSAKWSQADNETRKQLDEIAERALHRTLEAFQEKCGVTRRGKGSLEQERGKFVCAIFSHDTARGKPGDVPDPNRHFHAVVANLTVREDGTTGALDARPLFQRRMKMALGAMYRAELSKLLEEETNLRTYRPEREGKPGELASWWEISGVSPELMKAMSKRRQEIEKFLRKHGLNGAKAAEKAALRTRSSKERFTEHELNTAWARLGEEHGFSREDVKRLMENQVLKVPVDKVAERSDAVSKALEGLMEGQASFTENELLECTAIEAATRGIGIDDVLEAVNECLEQSPEVVRLKDGVGGLRSYSMKEMLAIEEAMLARSARLERRRSHPITLNQVQAVIRETPTLREEQREAVSYLCSGGDVSCMIGTAGTGKTFTMGIVREVYERAGFKVLGTALAAKAAQGLEDGSGIKSTHIHKLFYELKRGSLKLDKRTVLFVDECGMVGTRELSAILERVERAGAKAILVGDYKQLQSVTAGGGYKGITSRIGAVELDEIIRQKEEWSRKVVYDLRDGKAEDALQALADKGKLFMGEEREDAIEKLVSDWKEIALGSDLQLKETICFAGTNLEVRELNKRLQAVRLEAGELGETALEIGGMEFRVCDRVMVTRNNSLLNVRNGQMGEVTGVEGDMLWIRFDNGRQVEIDTNEFSNISHALALSTHKGQGITVDNALILTGDAMADREMSYVQGSRARHDTRMYADKLSAGDDLAKLMNRSRQKSLAYEQRIDEVA